MHLRSPLTFVFHLNIITNIFPITEMVTMLVTERSSPEMIPYGKAKVEIIKQNGRTKVCPSSVIGFPARTNFEAGGLFGRNLILCGGKTNSTAIFKCYILKNKRWTKFENKLAIPRHKVGSVPVIKNDLLWITGGKDRNEESLKSTEFIHIDGRVTPGPELPEPRSEHCMMSYQETILITGELKVLVRILEPTQKCLYHNKARSRESF